MYVICNCFNPALYINGNGFLTNVPQSIVTMQNLHTKLITRDGHGRDQTINLIPYMPSRCYGHFYHNYSMSSLTAAADISSINICNIIIHHGHIIAHHVIGWRGRTHKLMYRKCIGGIKHFYLVRKTN